MRTTLISVAMIAVLGFSLTAAAECIAPKAPVKVPDGATATQSEMVDTNKAVKQYDSDVNAYSSCIDQETKDLIAAEGPKVTDDKVKKIQNAQAKKQNAAVEALQAYAAKFNEQVRAFKMKQNKN